MVGQWRDWLDQLKPSPYGRRHPLVRPSVQLAELAEQSWILNPIGCGYRAGLERVVQAGAEPISWVSFACELQRDWARLETVPAIIEIVLTERRMKE